MDNSFLFIGGDSRIKYAADYIGNNYHVNTYGLDDSPEPNDKFRFIVLPLPFSRDGICVNAPLSPCQIPLDILPKYVADGAVVFAGGSSLRLEALCKDNGLTLIDYFSDESLTLKNAALTAEAAIAMLIDNTEYSLSTAEVLITGYGRIAYYTAKLLDCLGASVTIAARKAEQRTKAKLDGFASIGLNNIHEAAEKSDIIINTAPSALFNAEDIRSMKPNAIFMELATRRSTPEADVATSAGVKYLAAPGLPGKISPKTAGEAIAEAIIYRINDIK